MGLYRTVLGSDFALLAPALKSFHEHPSEAHGKLSVTHDSRFIARLLVAAMQLPKPGKDLPTVVHVTESADREIWDRHIGSSKFMTTQYEKNGFLQEQSGPIRFEFPLISIGGGIEFKSRSSYVFGIKIPTLLAPRIDALVTPLPTGWTVHVQIKLPYLGTVCQYEGEIFPV